MSSTFAYVTQQLTIYIGFPLLIGGILGSCLNIIVFSSLRTFRQSSCAFYLTILSFANLIQLCVGLLSRILISDFNIDWTKTSLVYCRFRPFILYLGSLLSAYTLCLATIDQYFATCTRVRLQQWCNMKIARRLLLICLTLIILEQIPSPFFYEHVTSSTTNQTSCIVTNQLFTRFDTYFTVMTLWFVLPLIISIFFASLAYRNVRSLAHRANQLVRRELDKQLTVMVLMHVLVNTVGLLPFLLFYLLSLSDSVRSDSTLYSQILLIFSNTLLLFYVTYSVSYKWDRNITESFHLCFFFSIRLHFTSTCVRQKDFADN